MPTVGCDKNRSVCNLPPVHSSSQIPARMRNEPNSKRRVVNRIVASNVLGERLRTFLASACASSAITSGVTTKIAKTRNTTARRPNPHQINKAVPRPITSNIPPAQGGQGTSLDVPYKKAIVQPAKPAMPAKATPNGIKPANFISMNATVNASARLNSMYGGHQASSRMLWRSSLKDRASSSESTAKNESATGLPHSGQTPSIAKVRRLYPQATHGTSALMCRETTQFCTGVGSGFICTLIS